MKWKFWKRKDKVPDNIKEIICPPPYAPTEKEHQLAYYKYMMDRVIYDELYGIQLDREGFPEKIGKPSVDYVKELDNLLDKLFVNDRDKEPLEKLHPYDKFKEWQLESLSDMHCGDCVAVPSSCMRCHAEDLYDIPDTATWRNKHEGWKLFNQYCDLIKKEKGK